LNELAALRWEPTTKSIRFITEGFDRQIGHTIEDGKTYTKD
jgi:hypothetical protein